MRIFYAGVQRLLTVTMETKSPYFSPKKTRNYSKKEGLTLLQKVTQGINLPEKNATGKKPSARTSKVKRNESNNVNVASENPATKAGKKRTNNIRTEGIKKELVKTETSTGAIVTPQMTNEKTPEKQQNSELAAHVEGSSLGSTVETMPEAQVKIKIEPVDEDAGMILQQTTAVERTPVKSEPEEVNRSPIKRELQDGYAEEQTDAKETKWEPENWRQMMENIREMRKYNLAPVDTMGCEQFTQNGDSAVPDRLKRYHCLVSLMLSSQTKDQANHECMTRLKKHGLTPESIVATESAVLQKLIYPISFYKNKTRFIKEASQILIDQYEGDIPNTIEGLLKLPGVGKKMAHLCMRSAWNVLTGIGVDTHVHRISNWLKWVPNETKHPEQTRQALEKWLPYELWDEVNHLLVGFGQTICTPRFPRCNDCLNASICPARGQQPIRKTPIKKEIKMEDLEF